MPKAILHVNFSDNTVYHAHALVHDGQDTIKGFFWHSPSNLTSRTFKLHRLQSVTIEPSVEKCSACEAERKFDQEVAR